jgi:hypothetical protein
MATTRNGKKRHNWVTNSTIVDKDVDATARTFVGWCGHLTPARDAELDNLIGVSDEVRRHNEAVRLGKTEGLIKPDEDAKPMDVDPLAEFDTDWMNEEPTADDLRAIEAE